MQSTAQTCEERQAQPAGDNLTLSKGTLDTPGRSWGHRAATEPRASPCWWAAKRARSVCASSSCCWNIWEVIPFEQAAGTCNCNRCAPTAAAPRGSRAAHPPPGGTNLIYISSDSFIFRDYRWIPCQRAPRAPAAASLLPQTGGVRGRKRNSSCWVMGAIKLSLLGAGCPLKRAV